MLYTMSNTTTNFDHVKLFLFTTDTLLAKQAEQAGVDCIIVDWEQSGKRQRQISYSTEINSDTPEDVAALAEILTIPITVRINPLDKNTAQEIQIALDSGAQIIMLPMAKNPKEVEQFISLVNGRAQTLVQIETQTLVEQCHELRNLDWNYAYLGLNDLMISRQKTWIWDLLEDGTVEQIFQVLENRQVGFGGVTRISGGKPVPFLEILHEMARLNCHLSVLRRTFKSEIIGRNLQAEIQAIRAAWVAARLRSPEAVLQDHLAFFERLRATKKNATF
ncbi:MAG: hypothetical protein RLZZ435_1557 [Cyanobacteriota bacterium]|jgi:hypothetical protein